jgi:hypothetical protein
MADIHDLLTNERQHIRDMLNEERNRRNAPDPPPQAETVPFEKSFLDGLRARRDPDLTFYGSKLDSMSENNKKILEDRMEKLVNSVPKEHLHLLETAGINAIQVAAANGLTSMTSARALDSDFQERKRNSTVVCFESTSPGDITSACDLCKGLAAVMETMGFDSIANFSMPETSFKQPRDQSRALQIISDSITKYGKALWNGDLVVMLLKGDEQLSQLINSAYPDDIWVCAIAHLAERVNSRFPQENRAQFVNNAARKVAGWLREFSIEPKKCLHSFGCRLLWEVGQILAKMDKGEMVRLDEKLVEDLITRIRPCVLHRQVSRLMATTKGNADVLSRTFDDTTHPSSKRQKTGTTTWTGTGATWNNNNSGGSGGGGSSWNNNAGSSWGNNNASSGSGTGSGGNWNNNSSAGSGNNNNSWHGGSGSGNNNGSWNGGSNTANNASSSWGPATGSNNTPLGEANRPPAASSSTGGIDISGVTPASYKVNNYGSLKLCVDCPLNGTDVPIAQFEGDLQVLVARRLYFLAMPHCTRSWFSDAARAIWLCPAGPDCGFAHERGGRCKWKHVGNPPAFDARKKASDQGGVVQANGVSLHWSQLLRPPSRSQVATAMQRDKDMYKL